VSEAGRTDVSSVFGVAKSNDPRTSSEEPHFAGGVRAASINEDREPSHMKTFGQCHESTNDFRCTVRGRQSGSALAQSPEYVKEATAVKTQMIERMRMKSSSNPDKDFVVMMISHHQGAGGYGSLGGQIRKGPRALSARRKHISSQEKESLGRRLVKKKPSKEDGHESPITNEELYRGLFVLRPSLPRDGLRPLPRDWRARPPVPLTFQRWEAPYPLLRFVGHVRPPQRQQGYGAQSRLSAPSRPSRG
jgi:hypothetical protein